MTKDKKEIGKEYKPTSNYMIDDVIFHPVFNESGVVVEAGMTTDGIKKITVDFPKVGKKRLVYGKQDK
ncbi:MAG: hypothetical protein PHW04_06330 [Candidatus Wallbacteria bacterium]|nr:hypothetical protein [Candidatus Wallbacteria bacterium]